MADAAELKHMVMSFRVSELQVMLGFCGRNKSGRKNELLQRALAIVQKGCTTPIQIKIKELYRRRFPAKNPNTSNFQSPPRISNTEVKDPHLGYSSYSSNKNSLESLLGQVGDFKHGLSPNSQSSALPVHPDVRLKHLPFYDILGELLKPTTLVPRRSTHLHNQECTFVFHLTPHQAQQIAINRDIRPNARIEYSVQVQLRFCLLETSCEQADNFPPSICVRVNGKMAPLPNPIPTNKPGVEPKRPSRPVHVTPLCRISPTVPNHISVSWASEFGRGYCVAVYLVRRLNSDILLQRLKQSGIRHPDHSRALIKEKLSHDPESEIATTSLRVSLLCPLGKMRMQIPCRASTCTHLQCYDASTFLQMNEKKPTWICPVCDKPAPFDKLIIDGLFSEIFNKVPYDNEIIFNEDCSWIPMTPKKGAPETTIVSTPAKGGGDGASATAAQVKKEIEDDVIDLTLESSDEEDDNEKTLVTSSTSESGVSSAPGSMQSSKGVGGSNKRPAPASFSHSEQISKRQKEDQTAVSNIPHVSSSTALQTTSKPPLLRRDFTLRRDPPPLYKRPTPSTASTSFPNVGLPPLPTIPAELLGDFSMAGLGTDLELHNLLNGTCSVNSELDMILNSSPETTPPASSTMSDSIQSLGSNSALNLSTKSYPATTSDSSNDTEIIIMD